MRMWWRSLFSRGRTVTPTIRDVTAHRAAHARLTDPELTAIARHAATTLPTVVAAAAVIASRVLGIEMHDEQIQAALALTDGHIVEMQTGEGKTLAAVPAVAWLARTRDGVHVLTANDYLARRDAERMREVYARMGLSTGWITQDLPAEARRAAYLADVTYATANEVGFDYLRDGLAMEVGEVVQRPLEAVAAVIDEADSILIDELLTILPHRPVARIDHPDRLFPTRAEKEAAVVEEVRLEQRRGRPVLVGTASVEESERLSRRLGPLPHHVLNARHEAREAEIVARAGEPGTVTISTNMAGRGVDIRLGAGAPDLGGLHVIGTNRHASRRIDHQLRGRAGRQGDPGSSRFFVSREDPLFVTHAEGDPAIDADQLQRMAEGQHLDVRLFLRKYESIVEGQRRAWREHRDDVLHGRIPCGSDGGHQVRLDATDEAWSDYLAAIAELRAGSPWQSLGGQDPLRLFAREAHAMFARMTASLDEDVRARLAAPAAGTTVGRQRGATWTYLTTDEPFGPMTERVMRGLVRLFRRQ